MSWFSWLATRKRQSKRRPNYLQKSGHRKLKVRLLLLNPYPMLWQLLNWLHNSGNVVEFTMWDDTAKMFKDIDFDAMEKPIIIAVSSCRVSKYRGILCLLFINFP